MLDETNQKKHLDILFRNGCFKPREDFFVYRSGQIGPYFVQSANVMTNGLDYQTAIKDMVELVRHEKDSPDKDFVISGGERRDWIFSIPVAVNLGVGPTMICKNGEILGANMNGKKVVHVADVNNEGSSPRDYWVPAIKSAGGRIDNIFFYIDRMEDGVQVMEDLGLRANSLVQLDGNAWDYMYARRYIDEKMYGALMERMGDRGAWARKMLRSEKGLARLAEINSITPDKVRAVLDKGYPDLKNEISELLSGVRF
ncbi:MAG: hypothetical protein AABX11_06885 [Nanoarchaeota archaeon]